MIYSFVSNRDLIGKCLWRVDWWRHQWRHVTITSQSSKLSQSKTMTRINYPCGPIKHKLSCSIVSKNQLSRLRTLGEETFWVWHNPIPKVKIVLASDVAAVVFSQLTASSSASWSLVRPSLSCVNGQESTMWPIDCRWPQSHSSHAVRPNLCQLAMTWALVCPEAVQQCPWLARQLAAWKGHTLDAD